MPQIFQVLKCYKCLVFQIHQTKKSNKFQCKMCGEKQSIKRHYGIGTSKDCRLHVQRLNGLRGEIDEINEQSLSTNDLTDDDIEVKSDIPKPAAKKSKWSEYVEEDESKINPNVHETTYLGNSEVVLEVPKKRAKTLGRPKTKTKTFITPHKNVLETDSSLNEHLNKSHNDEIITSSFELQPTINHEIQENKCSDSSSLLEFFNNVYGDKEKPTADILHDQHKKFTTNLNFAKVNSNSKWAQYVDKNEENDMEQFADFANKNYGEVDGQFEENVSCLEDGQFEVNRQFKDELQHKVLEGEQQHTDSIKHDQNRTQALFSLCDDDNDIDNILDI